VDIHSKKGSKVKFANPDSGYPHHQQDALDHLVVGEVYTVLETDVHNFATDVYLKGFPEIPFNSVLFDDV